MNPPEPNLPPHLEIPPNRRTGLGMTLGGLAMLSSAIATAASRSGWPTWLVLLGMLGLFMLITGLPLLLRKRPTLLADETGITATIVGSSATHIPWDLITGIELVGRGKGRMLAILVSDVDKALEHCPNSCRGIIKRYNTKYGVQAGAYVMSQVLGRPIESVAAELRALAVQYLEQAATADA